MKNSILFAKLLLQNLVKKFHQITCEKHRVFHSRLFLYINDQLINLFLDFIKIKFNINVKRKNILKFRLKIYESKWYKHNFNIYLIFLLYLVNLEIFPENYIDIVNKYYNKNFHIVSTNDTLSENCEGIFNDLNEFVELFNKNKSRECVCNMLKNQNVKCG